MTSSASTGKCVPSSLLHPERTDPERTLKAHVVAALDPQPFEGFGERLRVVDCPAVVVPPGGRPDLGVIAGPDDDGLALEPDRVAQEGRQQDPALAVEVEPRWRRRTRIAGSGGRWGR